MYSVAILVLFNTFSLKLQQSPSTMSSSFAGLIVGLASGALAGHLLFVDWGKDALNFKGCP